MNPLLNTQNESRAVVFDLYPSFSAISYEPLDFEDDGKLGLLSADGGLNWEWKFFHTALNVSATVCPFSSIGVTSQTKYGAL